VSSGYYGSSNVSLMGKPLALAGSDFIQRIPTGLSRKSPAGNDKLVCCDRELAAVPHTIAIESGTELAGDKKIRPAGRQLRLTALQHEQERSCME
jgi:hypothetical protein